MKLGIIDIGSNSIRLVLFDIKNQSYRTLDQVKHSVRLGQNMVAGRLDQRRIQDAVTVLKHFAAFMKYHKVQEIICVATEAVRKARNQNDFLSQAKRALGTEVRILSGLEEAYYDYLGCVNTLDLSDALILDVGGSSVEFILMEKRKAEESVSLPLGAIPLMEKFGLHRDASPKSIETLKQYLKEEFHQLAWLKKAKGYPLVGVGGSVRTLGRMDRLRKDQGPFIAHNYSLTPGDLTRIRDQVLTWRRHQGPKPAGLPRDREDLFLGPLFLMDCLTEELKSNKIFVSGAGVRDGLLFEYLFGEKKYVPDVLEFSLQNILCHHLPDQAGDHSLWPIAQQLYRLLAVDQADIRPMRKVLKTASYLHDLGRSINFFQKDRNTFYSILNAPIHGISQKQILLAASVASHSSAGDILKDYLGKKLLTSRDLRVIRKLGLILKLAEAIHYGNLGSSRLSLKRKDGKLFINLPSRNRAVFSKEQFSFMDSSFRSSFNLQLEFDSQVNPTSGRKPRPR